MATNKSAYLSNILLNWEIGTATPTPPANLYIALLTTMPTDNTGTALVEVTGTGYARQVITPAQWAAITTTTSFTQNAISNTGLLWPAAGSNWGTIVGAGEYDALTVGNLLRFTTLSTGSQSINTNNIFSLPATNVTRTES